MNIINFMTPTNQKDYGGQVMCKGLLIVASPRRYSLTIYMAKYFLENRERDGRTQCMMTSTA
jgi:hypothetical protein